MWLGLGKALALGVLEALELAALVLVSALAALVVDMGAPSMAGVVLASQYALLGEFRRSRSTRAC